MNPSRHIELDIDIGADARDWSAIQAQEKLKPVETELRRIEELVNEIVSEMDYLRTREQKLRDTNESTNERVKWFAFGTMGMLVGLGAWQVVYLRAYFRYVEPSDDFMGIALLTHGPARSILSRQRQSVGWVCRSVFAVNRTTSELALDNFSMHLSTRLSRSLCNSLTKILGVFQRQSCSNCLGPPIHRSLQQSLARPLHKRNVALPPLKPTSIPNFQLSSIPSATVIGQDSSLYKTPPPRVDYVLFQTLLQTGEGHSPSFSVFIPTCR